MSGCISMLSNLCRSSVILFERESALVSILSRGTSCGSLGFWSNWPLLLSIRFLSSWEGPEIWTPLDLMPPLIAFVWPLLQDCVSLVSLLSLDRGWCSVSWSIPMHSSTCIGLPWIIFCPLLWARQPVAVCSGWVLSFPVSLTSLARCPVSPARFLSVGWTRSCRKLYVFRGFEVIIGALRESMNYDVPLPCFVLSLLFCMLHYRSLYHVLGLFYAFMDYLFPCLVVITGSRFRFRRVQGISECLCNSSHYFGCSISHHGCNVDCWLGSRGCRVPTFWRLFQHPIHMFAAFLTAQLDKVYSLCGHILSIRELKTLSTLPAAAHFTLKEFVSLVIKYNFTNCTYPIVLCLERTWFFVVHGNSYSAILFSIVWPVSSKLHKCFTYMEGFALAWFLFPIVYLLRCARVKHVEVHN